MPLTREQFRRAREAGKTVDEIIAFENQGKGVEAQPLSPQGILPRRTVSPQDFPESTPFLPGEEKVKRLISERTDPVETLRKEVETPFDFKKRAGGALLKPIVTTGKLLDVPIARTSAAIGGFGLGLQRQKGFSESFRMGAEGLLGKKQFRAFDPARAAGVPGPIATGLELMSEILVPLKVLNKVNRIFKGPITKLSDKKLIKASEELVSSGAKARNIIGTQVDNAYAPINKTILSPEKTNKILNEFVDLPKAVLTDVEKTLGQRLDVFLENFTMEKARKLKRALADFRPGAFQKDLVGAIETAQGRQINRAYGSIKQGMKETLEEGKQVREAGKLLKADEGFEEIDKAQRVVKKAVIDPVFKKATRGGRAAKKLASDEDSTFRVAVDLLRSTGIKQKLRIDNAIDALESFNRFQRVKKIGGLLGRAAITGSVVGGVGARILGEKQ